MVCVWWGGGGGGGGREWLIGRGKGDMQFVCHSLRASKNAVGLFVGAFRCSEIQFSYSMNFMLHRRQKSLIFCSLLLHNTTIKCLPTSIA